MALLLFIGLLAPPLASSEVKTQDKSCTILFFGNSITAGYGVDRDQAFPALLQAHIDSLGWPIQTINAGLSGETSAAGLRRIDWVLRRTIDILVLELGGNDGLRGLSPESTLINLQHIIDRTRKKNPQVTVIIAGIRMLPNLGADYVGQFTSIYPQLAETNRALLIPHLLEDVAGDPKLTLDGIHPSPAGHQIVATTVWTTLEPVLRKLRPVAVCKEVKP